MQQKVQLTDTTNSCILYLRRIPSEERGKEMETKLSRTELARKIGVTYQYISYITKRERTPSPGMAEQLERATGVKREAWVWPDKYENPYIDAKKGRKDERQ
jgi:transcriptional regulator with XRE-family HTH domain